MKNKTGSVIAAFILGQIVQFFIMAVSTSFAPRQQLIFCGSLGAVVVIAFLFGMRVTAEGIMSEAILPPQTEDFKDEN